MSTEGLTPGHALYMRWVNAPGCDRERYWDMMNPADKEHWERLGAEVLVEVERLREAIDKAASALDVAGRDPRAAMIASCWLRTTLPPSHPNYMTPEAALDIAAHREEYDREEKVERLRELLEEPLANYDPTSDEAWSLEAWFDDVRTALSDSPPSDITAPMSERETNGE